MSRLALRIAAAAMLAAPVAVSAQSTSDFAAWISLIRNAHGAFAPELALATTGGEGRSPIVRARYGSWSFGPGDDETTNIGVGADFMLGTRRLRVDVLRSSVEGCADCGGFGLNAGMLFPLLASDAAASTGFEISMMPGLGFATWGDGDVTAITGTVEVPLALRAKVGNLRLRPFLTPGFGFARVSGASDSETGSLPTYGYGLAIGGARWDASAGVRQVVLEDAPDVMGVNFAWRW